MTEKEDVWEEYNDAAALEQFIIYQIQELNRRMENIRITKQAAFERALSRIDYINGLREK